jgi:TolA-binding protein
LFWGSQQKTTFDGNAGIGVVWKGLQFGFSVPQMLGNKINYAEDTTDAKTFYTHARHFMGTLGYKFYLSESKGISLTPLALARIVPNTPTQFEGNLNLDWQDKFWIGATYKSNYAVAANAGICINKKLYVGYSYDIIIGDIGQYSGISHEIMVNFKFGGKDRDEVNPDTAMTPDANALAGGASANRIDSLEQQLAESQEKLRQLRNRMDELARMQQQNQEQMKAMEANQAANQNNAMAANNNGGANTNAAANNTGNTNTAGNNTGNNKNSGGQTQNKGGQAKGGQNNASQEAGGQNTGNNNVGFPVSGDPNGLAMKQHTKEEIEKNVGMAGDVATDYRNTVNAAPKPGYYVVVGTFFYRDFAIAEMERFLDRGFAGTTWIYSQARQFNYIYTNRFDSQDQAVKRVKEMQAKGYPETWILQLR